MKVRIMTEYPGLVISSDGRIQGPSGRWLKPCPDSGGYMFITHCPGFRAGQKRRKVHVLVCEAFHGPRPGPGYQIAHGNGIKTDNRAENLRWATPSGNHQDKHAHGTMPVGERNGSSRMTESCVLELRRCWAEGAWRTKKEAAASYGISDVLVGKILRGEVWGWLK